MELLYSTSKDIVFTLNSLHKGIHLYKSVGLSFMVINHAHSSLVLKYLMIQ